MVSVISNEENQPLDTLEHDKKDRKKIEVRKTVTLKIHRHQLIDIHLVSFPLFMCCVKWRTF